LDLFIFPFFAHGNFFSESEKKANRYFFFSCVTEKKITPAYAGVWPTKKKIRAKGKKDKKKARNKNVRAYKKKADP